MKNHISHDAGIADRRPLIDGRNRVSSALEIIDTIAESLSVIKETDNLTDADLGGVMHKSADQGAKYRTGLAEMSAVSFLRALAAWNGRFAGPVLALFGMRIVRLSEPSMTDRQFAGSLARLQSAVNGALENDNEIDANELRGMLSLLDDVSNEVSGRVAAAGVALRSVA